MFGVSFSELLVAALVALFSFKPKELFLLIKKLTNFSEKFNTKDIFEADDKNEKVDKDGKE
jgi:Sec-independent protein translocase protein TatA